MMLMFHLKQLSTKKIKEDSLVFRFTLLISYSAFAVKMEGFLLLNLYQCVTEHGLL